jgi:hypothetical protein
MAAAAFIQFEFFDLSRIILHSGIEFCCPAKSEETAIGASSLFFAGLAVAIISIGECRKEHKGRRYLQMLHHDVAGYFAFSVQQTCSHQLRRMREDGDGQGLATLRRLVGVQQSGVQELTHLFEPI